MFKRKMYWAAYLGSLIAFCQPVAKIFRSGQETFVMNWSSILWKTKANTNQLQTAQKPSTMQTLT